MPGRRVGSIAIPLAVALLAWCAPSAGAAVTLGSALGFDPPNAPCVSGNCTVATTVLPGRTILSPVDGAVTTWRIRYSNSAGVSARVRVIRRISEGTHLGVNSSATQLLPVHGVSTFATETFQTSLPIRASDFVGLDLDGAGTNSIGLSIGALGSTLSQRWQPPLTDGGTSNFSFASSTELAYNADVEPEVTTITSHPKPKVKTRKKKARVTFAFSANQPGLGFQCSIDGGAAAACSSPLSFKARKGAHGFSVQTTLNGEKFGTSAAFDFKVKRKKR
jgi:hypothetical protein